VAASKIYPVIVIVFVLSIKTTMSLVE